MSYYSTQRLWSNERQNVTVFNWQDILNSWNESLNMNPYVQTVIDNLKAASDPDSNYSFPLEHFLKYLNWEKEGLTWFLYEVVSMRYMWGETRIDYVEELIKRPEIKLDEGFPVFPGSPRHYRTVRKFLTDSLSEDELDFIDMPSASVSRPAAPAAPVKASPKYADITIHLQRPDKNGKGQPDDVISIHKTSHMLHSISYTDGLNHSTDVFEDQDFVDVMHYVRNVIKLNNIDKQPFQFIQLTCPGAPSVIVDGETNVMERDLLYDALERTVKNWPVSE